MRYELQENKCEIVMNTYGNVCFFFVFFLIKIFLPATHSNTQRYNSSSLDLHHFKIGFDALNIEQRAPVSSSWSTVIISPVVRTEVILSFPADLKLFFGILSKNREAAYMHPHRILMCWWESGKTKGRPTFPMSVKMGLKLGQLQLTIATIPAFPVILGIGCW